MFYRDGIGPPAIERFTGHDDYDGYDGVMLDLPGTAAHLEFIAIAHTRSPDPHVEQLLALYLGDRAAVDATVARCGVDPVRSGNPQW